MNCILCVYSLPSVDLDNYKSNRPTIRPIHEAKTTITYPNGLQRDVCITHANIMNQVILTEEEKATTIVFIARNDTLYDMVHHPRGLMRFGLSKREKEAYVIANRYQVKEVKE